MATKVLILVLALAIVSAVAGEKKKIQCKGVDIKVDADEKKELGACLDKLKEKMEKSKKDKKKKESDEEEDGDDKKAKWKKMMDGGFLDMDFFKCKYEKVLKTIVDGKIDLDEINKRIENSLPKDVHEGMKESMKECAEGEGIKKLKFTDDDDKKSRAKFTGCEMKAWFKNCSDGKKGKKKSKDDEDE